MSNKYNQMHQKLYAASLTLKRQWDSTCNGWRDPVQQRFEKDYWQPLSEQTSATLKELEALGRVVKNARRRVK